MLSLALDWTPMGHGLTGPPCKRRKISSASFFQPKSAGRFNDSPAVPATPPMADEPHRDELAAYLALPQIEWQTEWDALKWWEQNAKKLPNLSIMARQYLGCPASSASVERLFSLVGINFSYRQQRSVADTLADRVFATINVM